jgi:cell division protease FtsH
MVMRFGMSEKLGPRVFGHDHGQPFLGREFSSEPDYSDEIAREIDDEIRRIVEEAHQTARSVLEDHREKLDLTSEILLRRETIEREQFIELLAGKTEDEVFGIDEPALPAPPPPAPEAPERKPERAPAPKLPRPGLAGGAAEMRANPPPEKP